MNYPKPFAPLLSPVDSNTIPQHFIREMRALKETIDGLLNMLPQPATEVPARPKDGMCRLAQGAWATALGVAAGKLVIYENGAWNTAP